MFESAPRLRLTEILVLGIIAAVATGCGTIRGTVVDDRNVPIPSATVQVALEEDESPKHDAKTDAAGRFTIGGLASGKRYAVKASAEGFSDSSLITETLGAFGVVEVQPRLSPVSFVAPDFDESGPPRVKLGDLATQWQRLPFLRLETVFHDLDTDGRQETAHRLTIPYDSTQARHPGESLFRDILRSPQLSTGILYDACPIRPEDKQKVEGSPTQRPDDIHALIRLSRQLSACTDENRNPFERLDSVLTEARRYYRDNGILPLVVVDVDIERLHDRVKDSLALEYDKGAVLRAPMKAFSRSNIFAVAPLESHVGHKRVKLVVDERFVITNREEPRVYSVSVNGETAIERRVGTPLLLEVDDADQTIGLQVGVGQSSSTMHYSQSALTSSLVPAYDLNWNPSCHVVNTEGVVVSIEPYVFYGANHDHSDGAPEIQNPFVIIGGYDQELFGSYSRMYDAVSRLIPGFDLIEMLRGSFDVVLLEYSDVGVSLQDNATALACTLQDINTRNQNSGDVVLVGISMGGLVSRMTLAGMENNAIPDIDADHHVRVWATIDTPHQGAHIPLGLQFLADHYSWLPVDEIDHINQLLNSTAAQEMLIEHHSNPEQVANPRTRHLEMLQNWGSFPTSIGTTVALASGALSYAGRAAQNSHHPGSDCNSGFFGPGCVTVAEHWTPLPENIVAVQRNTNYQFAPQDNRNGLGGLRIIHEYVDIGFAGIDGSVAMSLNDRPVQDRRSMIYHVGEGDTSEGRVFHTNWTLYVLPDFIATFVDNPSGVSNRSVQFGVPYSLMAGGWLSTPQDIHDALGILGPTSTLITGVEGAPMPRHTFVPIWSALDIPESYFRAYYDYLTKYASQLTWETWYGSNYLGGAALNRGEFSYEDYVDFDRILWRLSRPGFDGKITDVTLRSGAITEDPVTGDVIVESTTVRPSTFDWVYFNSTNRRHGELDPEGLVFLMERVAAEFAGTGDPSPGGQPPLPTNYVMVEELPSPDPITLLEQMVSYLEGLGLSAADEQNLTASLQSAQTAIESGDNAGAITAMEDFINDVDEMRGSTLPEEQADQFIDAANLIIGSLL